MKITILLIICFLYFCKSEPVILHKGDDPIGGNPPINEDEESDVPNIFQQRDDVFSDPTLLRVRADTKYVFSNDLKEGDFNFIKFL